MTGYTTDPAVLRGYAARWDDRAGQLGQLGSQLAGAQVGRESFGYVPGIGAKIYGAYTELLDGCRETLAAAAEGLGGVGEGLRADAEVYGGVEDANGADFDALRDWANGGGGGR